MSSGLGHFGAAYFGAGLGQLNWVVSPFFFKCNMDMQRNDNCWKMLEEMKKKKKTEANNVQLMF